MTMRTKYTLLCSCGHEGAILLSENDQPYSKNYESYSLENFKGGSFYSEGKTNWNMVFEELRPVCPECKKRLTKENLKVQ